MLTITIHIDNAAFEGGQRTLEIARILRTLASRLLMQGLDDSTIMDSNGNKVGSVVYVKRGEEGHHETV